MTPNKPQPQEELLEHLGRIEDVLRAIGKAVLAPTITSELADKKNRQVYDGIGKYTGKKLSKRTGFSTGKISGLLKRWEAAGLLIKDGMTYRKLF
jgi:hypothetical protein